MIIASILVQQAVFSPSNFSELINASLQNNSMIINIAEINIAENFSFNANILLGQKFVINGRNAAKLSFSSAVIQNHQFSLFDLSSIDRIFNSKFYQVSVVVQYDNSSTPLFGLIEESYLILCRFSLNSIRRFTEKIYQSQFLQTYFEFSGQNILFVNITNYVSFQEAAFYFKQPVEHFLFSRVLSNMTLQFLNFNFSKTCSNFSFSQMFSGKLQASYNFGSGINYSDVNLEFFDFLTNVEQFQKHLMQYQTKFEINVSLNYVNSIFKAGRSCTLIGNCQYCPFTCPDSQISYDNYCFDDGCLIFKQRNHHCNDHVCEFGYNTSTQITKFRCDCAGNLGYFCQKSAKTVDSVIIAMITITSIFIVSILIVIAMVLVRYRRMLQQAK